MSSTFSRVGSLRAGYNTKQVDAFLEQAKAAYEALSAPDVTATDIATDGELDFDESDIRSIAFDWSRDGYSPKEVDRTLVRLEDAFMHRKRQLFVAEFGENEWMQKTYEEAKVLYPRLIRSDGERFASARGQGYAKDRVDEFMARVSRYFDGKGVLGSDDVRSVKFPAAKNDDAYDESVVDVYLERLTQILTAVE